MVKKKLLKYIRVLISLVLIAWLIRMVGTANLASALARADLVYVVIMMIGANVDRVLMAYKWYLLLQTKQIALPMLNVVVAYYKASFWGSLFLPTVGADILRIYDIAQQTKRTSDVIASVVMERFIGLIATITVAIFSLIIFTFYIDHSHWKTLLKLGLFLLGAAAVLVFSVKNNWISCFRNRSFKIYWLRGNAIANVLKSYQDYAQHRRTLLMFLLLSIVEQFMAVIHAYLIAQALQVDVSFLVFVIFIPIIIAIVRLPISFDGFGVREALYVYLFGLVGVGASQAFLIGFVTSIISRIATALPTLYFFVFSSGVMPDNLDEAEQLA